MTVNAAAAGSACYAPRRQEVWVTAFSMIARRARRLGLDPATLCEGLGFSPADCESLVKRIDWEDFVVFLDRCAAGCGGVEAFERVLVDELHAFRAKTPLSGLCTSPRGAYVDMISWVFLNGYQSLDFEARELADGRIRWSCSVRPEYSPSEPGMRALCALAREFSELCDLPRASVEATCTDRDCECLITLPGFDTHLAAVRRRPVTVIAPRSSAAISHNSSSRVADRAIRWNLSPRETQVFDLVASGKQNKEVASILEVSVKTVEKHLANVMQKARVHHRTELLSTLLQP